MPEGAIISRAEALPELLGYPADKLPCLGKSMDVFSVAAQGDRTALSVARTSCQACVAQEDCSKLGSDAKAGRGSQELSELAYPQIMGGRAIAFFGPIKPEFLKEPKNGTDRQLVAVTKDPYTYLLVSPDKLSAEQSMCAGDILLAAHPVTTRVVRLIASLSNITDRSPNQLVSSKIDDFSLGGSGMSELEPDLIALFGVAPWKKTRRQASMYESPRSVAVINPAFNELVRSRIQELSALVPARTSKGAKAISDRAICYITSQSNELPVPGSVTLQDFINSLTSLPLADQIDTSATYRARLEQVEKIYKRYLRIFGLIPTTLASSNYLPAIGQETPVVLKKGNCRGVLRKTMFPFPFDWEGNEKAKEVCNGCKVIDECLEFAMRENIEHGVWGGLSEPERRSLKRRRRKTEEARRVALVPPEVHRA